MKNKPIAPILLHAVFFILASSAAMEAVADTDKQVIHHMQLQLRAVQQEKADLADQVEGLKKQVSELETKRAALEKLLGGQSRKISELADKQSSDKQQLAELSDNYKLLEQQYDASSKDLQQTKSEKEQEKKKMDGDIRVCEKKNSELYQLSVELMGKYQTKGVLDAMLQREPFTQLEKVRIENLLQEYRDRSDANRITSVSNAAQVVQHP